MSRYIDADAFLKSIGASEHCKDCECNNNDYECRGHSLSRQDICDIVDAIPSADVVEVVRCKDCKFQKVEYGWNCKRYKVCINFDMPMDDEDFCSWGERREDEVH